MPTTVNTKALSSMSEQEQLDVIEREVENTYRVKMAAIALSRQALAKGARVHYPAPDPYVMGWEKTACGKPVSSSFVIDNVGLEWVTCNNCIRICG